MRILGISFISIALTTIVVANAYYQKKQFYPSVVYITKSNPSMAVIYCQAFICVFLTGKLMRKVFFGELRTSEFEHLMERSWYAITETCLAFTVFRDDFNPKFVALFTLLLFLKSFHWLAEDRVDFMERSPIIGWLFHIRVLSLLLVLGALDFHFVQHAYDSTVTKGASVQLVFGFEYAILMTMAANIAIKYSLYSVDLHSETPWENKAVFLLYTELIMGFIKVILYLTFVVIMVRVYTLPLFAFRPMYYTIRNFKKAFNDVRLSRRAIHNMNTLYPDATPEELSAGDNVCIICREEMSTGCKKLPCNHIFHTACLRSWFQRQQTCPTCRLNILGPNVHVENRQARPQNPVPPQPPNAFQFPGPNAFLAPNIFNNLFNPNLRNAQQQQPNPLINAVAGNNNGNNNIQPPPPGGIAPPPQPPFQVPPFPFMNPFMTPPPPIPPQNLASLNREQLQQLEGNERENVEARIQWLRNIQIMLDASVIMLQQYTAAAALSMAPQNASTSDSSEPTPSTSTQNTQETSAEPSNVSSTTTTTTTSSTVTTTSPTAIATAPTATTTAPTVTTTSPTVTTTSPTVTTTFPTATTSSASPSIVATSSSDSAPTNGLGGQTDKQKSQLPDTIPGPSSGDNVSAEEKIRLKRLQKFVQNCGSDQE